MVKLQTSGVASIVSVLPIDEKMAQKIRKNPNIVKDMLKDLHGDHLIEKAGEQQYSCFGCSISDDKIENLEERIAALKSFHKSFLEMVEDLPDADEPEEAQTNTNVINEIAELLKVAKEKATEHGMSLTSFLENDKSIHYFGYMPASLFMMTKLPVILAHNEDSHE